MIALCTASVPILTSHQTVYRLGFHFRAWHLREYQLFRKAYIYTLGFVRFYSYCLSFIRQFIHLGHIQA